jgi:hypothetical protein
MAYEPTNRTEGQIYTKYMLAQKPGARSGILYQNDDFGKDYQLGVKDVLGDKYGSVVVKEASYEETRRRTRVWTARLLRCRLRAQMYCCGGYAQIRCPGDPEGA